MGAHYQGFYSRCQRAIHPFAKQSHSEPIYSAKEAERRAVVEYEAFPGGGAEL